MDSSTTITLFLSCSIILLASSAQALVPLNATFKYVNEGNFGDYIVEYDGTYRVLSIANSPFQMAFYNTTPNAYTLALRMGTTRSESLRRWVWEANRGNPVGEKATLTFGSNGNLVLADANGRIAWQTNTANKGVVDFQLLSNGNIVLRDTKGNFVWQSFDYPTDTLLVGQSLRLGSATKLMSRASETINSNGPYSLVMEPTRLAMYYKSSLAPKPYLYFTSSQWFGIKKGPLQYVTLNSSPETDDGFAYEVTFTYQVANSSTGGNLILTRPKYDATLSFLRLDIDGNLKVYTYDDNVDWGAWETSFTLFSRDSIWETECQLPGRCGTFGLCEDNQCVACPLSKGLMGWSKNCSPEKLASCKNFHYYQLEGVDHFLMKYTRGDGPTKQASCGSKCSKDCKCLGYFYNKGSSMCWIANDLKTLTKVDNSTHVAYLKAPNR